MLELQGRQDRQDVQSHGNLNSGEEKRNDKQETYKEGLRLLNVIKTVKQSAAMKQELLYSGRWGEDLWRR